MSMSILSAALPSDPQALAEQVATAMMSGDACARHHGIRVVRVAPSSAVLEMVVSGDLVNGHNLCHGGVIYTLADTAFAYAANSINVGTLTSGATIDYFAPALKGDTLVATAKEIGRSGRLAMFDVDVTNHEGRLIARYRGRGYRLKDPVIAAAAD